MAEHTGMYETLRRTTNPDRENRRKAWRGLLVIALAAAVAFLVLQARQDRGQETQIIVAAFVATLCLALYLGSIRNEIADNMDDKIAFAIRAK